MLTMVFLSFIMSIFIGIQDPIIQKFTIRIAGGYISSKTGTDVQIGRLYISPNFTIEIEHLLLKDLHDTDLLMVEELKVRPSLEEIVHGNIHLNRIELTNAHANLITYEGEDHLNLQFLLDLFATDKEPSDKPVTVLIDRILLKDVDFQYWDQNHDKPENADLHEMDYAHIQVQDINLDLAKLSINGTTVNAKINHLAAVEASGFKLIYLESLLHFSDRGVHLDNLHLESNHSLCDLDLHMDYNGFHAFRTFVDSVTFNSTVRPSKLKISDLGPFAKVLYTMTDEVYFEGHLTGPVADMKMDQLKASIGKQTKFEGAVSIQPLDFFHGKHTLTINKMRYTFDDINNFHIPGPTKTIPLPEMLSVLEQGNLQGSFSGTYGDFLADINATSAIGDVQAIIRRHTNEFNYDVFEGTVEAQRLDVGALTKASNILGEVDLSANVIGRLGQGGDMDLDLEGNLFNARLLGNDINEVSLTGNLHNSCVNGRISIDDDEIELDLNGRFDFSNPKALSGDFKADIVSADLYSLHFLNGDKTALLSASIQANAKNLNQFSKTEGAVKITNFSFTNSNSQFNMQQFDGSIVNDPLLKKKIDVNCDYLDFELAGLMDFATLGTAFKQFVSTYVEIPQWTASLEAFEQSGKSADQDFIITMNLKDPKPFTDLFIPNLSIAKNTSLNGTFTTRSHSLNMTLRSRSIKFNNIRINNVECKSLSSPRRALTRLYLDEIILRDSTQYDSDRLGAEGFTVINTIQHDSILTNILWDDMNLRDLNKGNILTSFIPTMNGGRLNISKADILLYDSTWTILPDNLVEIDNGRTRISNIVLQHQDQKLTLDGFVPMNLDDTLSITMSDFNVSTFDFITKGMGFDLDGIITGNALMSNIKNDMTILANLNINGIGFNGDVYGDAEVASQWNNAQKAIELDFGLTNHDHRTVHLAGSFFTERKDNNLDFKLTTSDLNLAFLDPFVSNIAHRIQGRCDGAFDIKGSISQPDIKGQLKIKDGGCKINFLNTYYTFSPTITLSNRYITFSDLSLIDTLGNSALVTGYIQHDHLKDMALNITMMPINFLALATTAKESPAFYGTAIATGTVEVKGPFDDIKLDIKARSQKGTVMTIPIGESSSVSQHGFITFVNNENIDVLHLSEDQAEPKKSSSFQINLDLDVNNNAQIKISLPNNLGAMEAKGDGNIKLGVSSTEFSLIGDYVIEEGSLGLNVQNVIHRNFLLDPGSSISWTGNPIDGIINATGVYQTKAPISSLGLVDSTSTNSSNIKVECLVHLKNKLLNPDISFGLRLPNASEDLKQTVFYVIDTTNEANMLMQTISLLVFNSFSYGSSVNGYDLLTGQLNDFLSQFSKDIDINLNYRPGNDITNEEWTVALKKQLFNDRLTIETNFGVIIPNSTYASSSTNIVGDVNIDYKITKDGRLSAQVFNRSNYNTSYYQYTFYKMAPYTQGVGLSYSKSFDRFSDLFRRRTTMTPLSTPGRPILGKPRSGSGSKAEGQTENPKEEHHDTPE